MPRRVDLRALKRDARDSIDRALGRIDWLASKLSKAPAPNEWLFVGWTSAMTAVEIHAVWERYVENRLVAALNHKPSHFINDNQIKGITAVSAGLARYVVRGGRPYFDFRSVGDLFAKGDGLLGRTENPFRTLTAVDINYIDAAAAVRNCIVHDSDAARASYRRHLRNVYGISSAPDPDEFLNAKDRRAASPDRYKTRLAGIATVLKRAIAQS